MSKLFFFFLFGSSNQNIIWLYEKIGYWGFTVKKKIKNIPASATNVTYILCRLDNVVVSLWIFQAECNMNYFYTHAHTLTYTWIHPPNYSPIQHSPILVLLINSNIVWEDESLVSCNTGLVYLVWTPVSYKRSLLINVYRLHLFVFVNEKINNYVLLREIILRSQEYE